MKVFGRIACLTLLPAMMCTAPATAQPARPAQHAAAVAPTPLPTSGDIILFQSARRLLAMMRIGQGELVPMVFDTGSDGHSIDRLIVTRARLRRVGTAREIDGTTGAQRDLTLVRIPDVSIGGLRVGAIDAVALDYDRNDAMGIISSEMFTGSLLYLDLANDRARLVPRDTSPLPEGQATDYVRDIPSTHIVMPDGSTLPAHFDTGYDGELSLPIAMMDKVPLMAPARVVGRFRSINTEGEVYGGQVRGSIRIGPVTLENPRVTFLGDLANIGLPVIRRVTLVIDPAANRNWVLAPGSVPPLPRP